MNHYRSDFWEIMFSVAIPLLVVIGIMILIMAAPSLDAVIWGR